MTDSRRSLEVLLDGSVVFASEGKWLHPLLDLERFLLGSSLNPAALSLRDKIVGRAAALLIVRLRIPEVHAGLLSRLGEQVLLASGVRYTCGERTGRIACLTEEILEGVDDPEEAHRIVVARAAASRAGAAASARDDR